MQNRRNENQYSLGEFEEKVLMAVMRLGDKAYGVSVQEEIEKRIERRCSFGALYTTLDRLEDKGFLSSSLGESSSERGGRAKRYFRLEGKGIKALKASLESTFRMAEGLPLLEGAR